MMNTLTKFIDISLNWPKVRQYKANEIADCKITPATYDIIENETIINEKLDSYSISGSLFSLSTFKKVTFRSCVFFATRIENCNFKDCHFINCSFHFSHISLCNFSGCHFEMNNWELSPIKGCEFRNSKLGHKTLFFVNKESQQANKGNNTKGLEWSEVISLPPIPNGEITETTIDKRNSLYRHKKMAA